MRNITTNNLISIETGFGFVRNTEAGMGDVRVDYCDLYVRTCAKRSHQASSAASAAKHAHVGERLAVSACGRPQTAPCVGPTAQIRQRRWASRCLPLSGRRGPSVSSASLGISS